MMVTFVIPIRHPSGVRDSVRQVEALDQTLRRLFAQDDPRFRVRIACNAGQPLPKSASNAEIVTVDLPPNDRLRSAAGRQEAFEAIRQDKGRRVLAAVEMLQPTDTIMVVDDDDLLSRRIVSEILTGDVTIGRHIERGYVWQGNGSTLVPLDNFHLYCGSSLAIPGRYFAAIRDGRRDANAIAELGSHRIVAPSNPAFAFVPLRHRAAIYRQGHENASHQDVAQATSRSAARSWRSRLKSSLLRIASGRSRSPKVQFDLNGAVPLDHADVIADFGSISPL